MQERLAQLEQLLHRQQADVAAWRASGPEGAVALPAVALPYPEPVPPAPLPDDDGISMTTAESTPRGKRARSSRRALLKLGGAAAAAGVAVVAVGATELTHPDTAQAHPAGSPFYNSVTGAGQNAIFGQGFSGAHGTLGFTDSGFGIWGHSSSADPNNPGTAGFFTNGDAGSGAYGNGVSAIAQNGAGAWGLSAHGAGVWGEAQASSFSPGVLGTHDGTGYGVQAFSNNGAIDLYVGSGSKVGVIAQALWGGSGVPGMLAGTQLRDLNADLWIGTGLGSRKVAALAPNFTRGGSINYLNAPVRLLDARTSPGTALVTRGPLVANETYAFTVAGLGGSGIPAGAQGLIGNVTVLGPSGVGNLSLFPAPGPGPSVASMTFGTPGLFLANGVNVAIGTGGKIMIQNQSSGTTPLVIDAVAFVM
jgi:hypothetical protein